MTWILSKITGNPIVLLGVILAAFAAGGGAAWKVQGYRLDALQSRFDAFVSTVRAEGEKAEIAKQAKIDADKLAKEHADAENKSAIDKLRADNQRLRDSRSRGSFLPPSAPASKSPDRACFKRPDLERAIQQFDSDVSGLVEQGDIARVNLDTAKKWAMP